MYLPKGKLLSDKAKCDVLIHFGGYQLYIHVCNSLLLTYKAKEVFSEKLVSLCLLVLNFTSGCVLEAF